MSGDQIPRVPVQEIIVDVLGSLVPGLMCVIASMLMFLLPAELFLTITLRPQGEINPSLAVITDSEIAQLLGGFRLEFIAFVFMTSYVIGHIFYRRGPHEPDKKSLSRILKKEKKQKSETKNWVADNPEECRFPYPNLKGYLEARGLHHLASLVTWQRTQTDECSKMFINVLKVRLYHLHPERCTLIAKNEAHIRLMSSTWFMARTLKVVGSLSVALTGVTLAYTLYFNSVYTTGFPWAGYLAFLPAIAVSIAGIAISYWIIGNIETFLHYQRVREAVIVLETAWVAFREKPELLRVGAPIDASRAQPATVAEAASSALDFPDGASAKVPKDSFGGEIKP